MRPNVAACLALAVVLTGCGDRGDGAAGRPGAGGTGESSLPTPAGASGSAVTGMPHARAVDAQAPADPALAPDAVAGADGTALPEDAVIDPANPAKAEGVAGATPGDVSPQEAAGVVREYYTALNSGAYDRAYTLWADGGRASGQSPDQFANVFAQTEGHAVEISAVNRVEATADGRQAEVPVSLTARQRDGTQRRFIGRYVLRYADAEGAWRIVSADLREAAP